MDSPAPDITPGPSGNPTTEVKGKTMGETKVSNQELRNSWLEKEIGYVKIRNSEYTSLLDRVEATKDAINAQTKKALRDEGRRSKEEEEEAWDQINVDAIISAVDAVCQEFIYTTGRN